MEAKILDLPQVEFQSLYWIINFSSHLVKALFCFIHHRTYCQFTPLDTGGIPTAYPVEPVLFAWPFFEE